MDINIFENIEKYKGVSVGDLVMVRGKHLPPCDLGVKVVHSKIIEYIRLIENKFTITRMRMLGHDLVIVNVFEVSPLLDFGQIISLSLKKIKILNRSDIWKTKLLNSQITAK